MVHSSTKERKGPRREKRVHCTTLEHTHCNNNLNQEARLDLLHERENEGGPHTERERERLIKRE